MNKQGPRVEHRALYPISWYKPEWKSTYMCMTKSLCCTAEINTNNTVNQLYFDKKKEGKWARDYPSSPPRKL